MTPFLIVTDLDSTLVGNNAALEDFNEFFEEHRRNHGSKLVYATGRSLRLYKDLESEVNLLRPDGLITSVGSEIYTADGEMDGNWANHLSANWDLELVKQITSEYEQLMPQPESEQRPFKVSFLLRPEYRNILEDLEQRLNAQNIKAQVIYSSDRDVDILPERSDKGNALSYARGALDIAWDRTLVCGDSGNDIALFAENENTYGIIVGNARSELIEWYGANKRPKLYLAEGPCAVGVLEGLRHFNLLYE
jgi:sucrose-6-phosphatase